MFMNNPGIHGAASILLYVLVSPLLLIIALWDGIASALGCARKRAPTPKTIIISGGSSGIGAQLALDYAKEGVTLGLTGRNEGRLEKIAAECREKGADVETFVGDVCDEDGLREWLEEVDGQTPVDLVVANAGIAESRVEGSDRVIEDSTRQIFDTNVTGVFNTVLPLLEQMRERKSGQIAIVGSIAGDTPLTRSFAYSASKTAVKYWAAGARATLYRDGVRVNLITPGYVRTPLTDLNKFKMADMVEVKDASRFIIDGLKEDRPVIKFPFKSSTMATFANLLTSVPVVQDFVSRKGLFAPLKYLTKRRSKTTKSS